MPTATLHSRNLAFKLRTLDDAAPTKLHGHYKKLAEKLATLDADEAALADELAGLAEREQPVTSVEKDALRLRKIANLDRRLSLLPEIAEFADACIEATATLRSTQDESSVAERVAEKLRSIGYEVRRSDTNPAVWVGSANITNGMVRQHPDFVAMHERLASLLVQQRGWVTLKQQVREAGHELDEEATAERRRMASL
ncbi:MAG: hypothetical protein H0T47_10165 [Planctomycetaceae bacterium]|nr:hypothetical protein [Planctomycetaceae bacterium]